MIGEAVADVPDDKGVVVFVGRQFFGELLGGDADTQSHGLTLVSGRVFL